MLYFVKKQNNFVENICGRRSAKARTSRVDAYYQVKKTEEHLKSRIINWKKQWCRDKDPVSLDLVFSWCIVYNRTSLRFFMKFCTQPIMMTQSAHLRYQQPDFYEEMPDNLFFRYLIWCRGWDLFQAHIFHNILNTVFAGWLSIFKTNCKSERE